MSVYCIHSRRGLAISGVAGLGAGGIFVLAGALWALGLIELNDKSRAMSAEDFAVVIAAIGAGCFVGYLGWRSMWRQPYEVRVDAEGTVVFAWVLAETRVPSADIRAVEKTVQRPPPDEGDARGLRVRHVHGTVALSYFPEAERFIADVRALNPGVQVSGRWSPEVS